MEFDPVEIGWRLGLDLVEPSYSEVKCKPPLDVATVTRCLSHLVQHEFPLLYTTARENDVEGFIDAFRLVRNRVKAMESSVQYWRGKLSLAVLRTTGNGVEINGRVFATAHLFAYCLSRVHLLTVWAAVDEKRIVDGVSTGDGCSFEVDEIRSNWQSVRKAIGDLESDIAELESVDGACVTVRTIAATLGAEREAVLAMDGAKAPEIDGPVAGCRWRHNGELVKGTMQATTWRVVNHLWSAVDNSADSLDLARVAEGDNAVGMPDLSDGALRSWRQNANKFFSAHRLPFKVSVRGSTITLAEK